MLQECANRFLELEMQIKLHSLCIIKQIEDTNDIECRLNTVNRNCTFSFFSKDFAPSSSSS